MSQTIPIVLRTQVTVENGLASKDVNWILQDKQGLVWLATRNGVLWS